MILEHKPIRPCIWEAETNEPRNPLFQEPWELRYNSADKKEIKMYAENKKNDNDKKKNYRSKRLLASLIGFKCRMRMQTQSSGKELKKASISTLFGVNSTNQRCSRRRSDGFSWHQDGWKALCGLVAMERWGIANCWGRAWKSDDEHMDMEGRGGSNNRK